MKKTGLIPSIIFIIGFCIRLFMAHIDPFLHNWDERFHALVAENMMKQPFKPMLYTQTFINYDPNSWCCNTVWLHKQPLFLWQMALSMKLFGVSEFSIRYPSVLLGAFMVLLVFRISFLLTSNKFTASIAAILMCFSCYQLELISGKNGMDHNDVAFGFYVLASIWGYCEYLKSPKWYWVLLIGVFSGCAVLNKWLTGLLVFSAWGVNMLSDIITKNKFKPFFPLFFATIVSCLVFLPWQFYIFHYFPKEALFELQYNSRHIYEVVETHGGDWTFYYSYFNQYFGENLIWFGYLGIILSIFQSKEDKIINSSLLLYITLVFVFFSFIVKTKMSTYFFVIAPLVMIYIAIGVERIIAFFKNGKFILVPLLILCIFNSLNPYEIAKYRREDQERATKIYNTNIYKKLKNIIPKETKVVMNVNSMEHIDCMFYNNDITAYQYCLDNDAIKSIEQKGISIAVFKERYGYNLSDKVKDDQFIFTIPNQLK